MIINSVKYCINWFDFLREKFGERFILFCKECVIGNEMFCMFYFIR